MTGPFVIAIAGPSCSGKSTIAARLAERLEAEGVARIALDAYYRDLSHLPPEAREAVNFDEPAAWDWPRLEADLEAIGRGEAAETPVYDFKTHTRIADTRTISAAPFIVAEGLFALAEEAPRARYGLVVYVEASDALCLERRLARDVAERGRTRASVIAQFEATVRPMAARHIRPCRERADLVVDGAGGMEAAVDAILRAVEVRVGRAIGPADAAPRSAP